MSLIRDSRNRLRVRTVVVALAGQGVPPLGPCDPRCGLLRQHLRRPLADPPACDQGRPARYPRVQDVAGDDQVNRPASQVIRAPGVGHAVLDLPDDRPLVSVLDPPPLPGPIPQIAAIRQLFDPPQQRAPAGQPRDLATAAPTVAAIRPVDHPRRLESADGAQGNLADEAPMPRHQAQQELGLAAIALVEGHPVEVQGVARGAVVEIQGDPPLGPTGHPLGDLGLLATGRIPGPILWEMQLAVELAVGVVGGVVQVDRECCCSPSCGRRCTIAAAPAVLSPFST